MALNSVDFLLSEHVILEVNGTYWHADPRFYPDGPVHVSQKRTVEIYTKKMELLHSIGFQVIEIWEHDIKLNAHDAVISALNKIAN